MGRSAEFVAAAGMAPVAPYSAAMKKAADKTTSAAFRVTNKLDWQPLTPEGRSTALQVHSDAAQVHRNALASARAAGHEQAVVYHRRTASHHEVTAAKYDI